MGGKTQNPFRYGPPVKGNDFVNREDELRAVFNRMRTGQSTAIVGEPHSGKTSFLFRLSDPAVQNDHFSREEIRNQQLKFIDLHDIPNGFVPRLFWEDALVDLVERPGRKPIGDLLAGAKDDSYSKRSLEKLFSALASQGRRLVLLMDEFDVLLKHKGFQDPEFFTRLRSLANNTGGLVLIPASRMTIGEMNAVGRGLLDTGSPFFNNMIPETLKSFDDEAHLLLFLKADSAFNPTDHRFIRRVAGSNPFALQAMAGALWETQGVNRPVEAAERFYDQIASHFDDLWYTMDDETRTTAVILSLLEFGGRAMGADFNFGEIERVDRYGPELRKLADRGLAELVESNGKAWLWDWEHLLAWRNQRWTVSSQAFAWWVRDVVISKSRKVPKYDEWLQDKRYRFLLTEEQWRALTEKFKNAPSWAVHGVGALARELWDSLRKQS